MADPTVEHAIKPADFVKPGGGFTGFLQLISSLLFKLTVYIFLRWIPSRAAHPVIPALYTVYLLTSLLRDYRLRSAIRRYLEQHDLADPDASTHLKQLAERIETSEPKLQDKKVGEPVSNSPSPAAKGQQSQPASISKGKGAPSYAKVAAEGSEALKGASDSDSDATAVAGGKPRAAGPRRKVGRLTIPEILKALVFGVSTRSPRLNFYILLAHTIALAMFLDSFFSPYLFPSHWDYNLSFARVGAISPTSAKVHVRYPHPLPPFDGLQEDMSDELGFSGILRDGLQASPEPVRVIWRRLPELGERQFLQDGAAAGLEKETGLSRRWERGPLLRLTEETDWTTTAVLDNLWPSTRYEWRLAFVHNNTFTPVPERAQQFTTWPDPRLSQYLQTRNAAVARDSDEMGIEMPNEDSSPVDDPNHFSFASTSCVKPDFPYHPAQFWAWNWLLKLAGIGSEPGGIAQRNRIPGFDLLYKRAIEGKAKPSLRFLLQLGDLIYADVPHYGGPTKDAYRKLYRNLFASDSFRRVYENLPTIGIYDDHEVVNNWSGKTADGTTLESFPPANTAWKEYVGLANPDPLDEGENYYTFRYGGSAAFFVMDTRKHRSHYQQDDDEDKTMLGERQKDALLRWLGAVNSTSVFKFVVSSVPFNTLWGGPLDWDGQKDSWAAYMSERGQLASVMQYVPNLIVLSGDRHEFAATSIRDTITEFSTSPLSMFYLPIRTLAEDHGAGAWGEDKLYKYIPDGNHKWSEFEVDTRDPYKPVVRVSVQVDGKEAWQVSLLGKPVRRAENVVGSIAKSLLELLGFKPRRWF
ncbi:uncharacterized protein PFL1_06440 [Pseudozyma flocculosa PF-1]|uniref:PhoD-like phosphatase metallophosphatase domain-containing protein n=1 Tax=Pseudozyma flocculosa PF-1 TaxID=1277687 RepID=A0A061H2H3_9BASI|nr:uncharacterized protein PFL1_06440 [Pseudozyma flocculosa PF-1]EPQ25985.1 hypothetical protein PFL1_06440 [Pseudozyma flocculosa PF-1]